MNTTQTNRSDSAVVRKAVQQHILAHYEDDIEALTHDVVAAGGAVPLVEGGSFLISYYDQRQFIDALNLNNKSGKEFDNQQVWGLYKLLLSREILNLTGIM